MATQEEQTAQLEENEGGIMKMIADNKMVIGALVVVVILLVVGYVWFMAGDATSTEHFSSEITNQQMLIGGLVVVALYMAMGTGSAAERLHLC